jgi:hypothetical protein
MILDLTNINLWHPRVCVNHSYENFIGIYVICLKERLFQMFSTPRNVARLSFLFKLTNVMLSVAHQSELIPVLFDKLFRFEIGVLLMGLHS